MTLMDAIWNEAKRKENDRVGSVFMMCAIFVLLVSVLINKRLFILGNLMHCETGHYKILCKWKTRNESRIFIYTFANHEERIK